MFRKSFLACLFTFGFINQAIAQECNTTQWKKVSSNYYLDIVSPSSSKKVDCQKIKESFSGGGSIRKFVCDNGVKIGQTVIYYPPSISWEFFDKTGRSFSIDRATGQYISPQYTYNKDCTQKTTLDVDVLEFARYENVEKGTILNFYEQKFEIGKVRASPMF